MNRQFAIAALTMRHVCNNSNNVLLSSSAFSAICQRRHNSDDAGIDVSHLWGERTDKVFKYLKKHNMMPEAQEGSKGYGMEGHVMNIGGFPDAEPVVVKAISDYPKELVDALNEPSGKEIVEKGEREGTENFSPRMLKLYKKYKRRQQIKEANHQKTL